MLILLALGGGHTEGFHTIPHLRINHLIARKFCRALGWCLSFALTTLVLVNVDLVRMQDAGNASWVCWEVTGLSGSSSGCRGSRVLG